ncbi:hypothetical protein OAP73_06085 [Methylophilaceae bacterium]|nr:hypothetical protein [Methylophilaceae bacterium]
MKKILLLLLLLPNLCFSAWDYVYGSSDAKDPIKATYVVTYYADFSTFKKISKDKVRLLYYGDTVMKANSKYNPSDRTFMFSVKIYAEFDCKYELETELSKTHYMNLELKGEQTVMKDLEKNRIITPKTNQSAVFDSACSKR